MEPPVLLLKGAVGGDDVEGDVEMEHPSRDDETGHSGREQRARTRRQQNLLHGELGILDEGGHVRVPPLEASQVALEGAQPLLDELYYLDLSGDIRRIDASGSEASLELVHEGAEIVDVEVWGLKLRLHSRGNLSEQRLLLMPQHLDELERRTLARELKAGDVVIVVEGPVADAAVVLTGDLEIKARTAHDGRLALALPHHIHVALGASMHIGENEASEFETVADPTFERHHRGYLRRADYLVLNDA